MIANMSVSREKEAFSSFSFSFLSKHTGQMHPPTHIHTHIAAQKGFMVMIEKIIKDSNTRNDIIQKKWAGLHPQHPGPLSATTASDVHRGTLVLSRDSGCHVRWTPPGDFASSHLVPLCLIGKIFYPTSEPITVSAERLWKVGMLHPEAAVWVAKHPSGKLESLYYLFVIGMRWLPIEDPGSSKACVSSVFLYLPVTVGLCFSRQK